MKFRSSIGLCSLAVMSVAATASAAIINVPGDQPTIQAGIDAAVNGDVVVVAEGEYPENIDFIGKAITVESTDPSDPEVVANTIINGGGSGTVVTCVSGEGPNTVLSGFVITGGTAPEGGGMRNVGSSPTVTYCSFIGNTADAAKGLASGGGMYNLDSSPTVDHCTFSGNAAGNSGGGMYNLDSSPTVNHCTFSGNTGGNSGGGMHNSLDSNPTVTNCTFSMNTANLGGGMTNFNSSHPMVTSCTFSENTAIGGGGVYCAFNSNPTVNDCTFDGNTATDSGGGLLINFSSPTVTSCTFSVNTAPFGGGMVINDSSSPTVDSCTFDGNTATNNGGGMIIDDSSPTLNSCTFDGNTATNDGGGLFICCDSSPTVTSCLFKSNTAQEGGGGVWIDGSDPIIQGSTFVANSSSGANGGGAIAAAYGSTAIVSNTLMIGNVASGEGGATIALFSTMHISNSTVVANEAGGFTGGVCSFGASSVTTVSNSIVYSNRVPDGRTDPQVIDLPLDDPSETTIEYCNIEGGWSGPGSAVIDLDPGFMNPPDPGPDDQWGTPDDDSGDLRLSPQSPCIDAGSNWATPRDDTDLDGDGDISELIPLDADGNPRFADALAPDAGCGVPVTVDIGALEAAGTSVNPIVYADITGDGVVDVADLLQVILDWGPCGGCCLSDLDLDGQVRVDELLDLIQNWS